MPLYKISGADAIRNIKSNPYAAWPSRHVPEKNRIEPVCTPAFQPSFKLEHGEKIFTIGSCFARNIENELSKRGYDVVTSSLSWPDRSVENIGNGVLNNYGVASIANEIRWALDPSHPFDPDDHFVQLGPNKFIDLHIPQVKPASLEKMIAYRKAITEVTRRLVECRVIIITLGLSELWFDRRSQTYLNLTPLRSIVSNNPDRFELHVLSFEETIAHLREAIRLLRSYGRETQKILLTVSPVPLGHTHTQKDVLVINSYSKSVLRSSAETICAGDPDIDYFPSFESVTLSPRDAAWQDDQVHVNPELVRLNVERMIEAYKPEAVDVDEAYIREQLTLVEEALQLRKFFDAIRILEPLRSTAADTSDFVFPFVETCMKLGRIRDARDAVDQLPSDFSTNLREMLDARVLVGEGYADRGVGLLERLSQEQPKSVAMLRQLIEAYVSVERYDDALVACLRWSKMMPAAAGPLGKMAAIHRARGDVAAAERAYRIAMEHRHASPYVGLEYVELLIEQRRLTDAARALDLIRPDTSFLFKKCQELRAALPVVASGAQTPKAENVEV